MNTKRFISFSTILLTTVSSVFSQCIVGGTEFNTEPELCNPTMVSDDNEENGWFSSNVAEIIAKQCSNSNFFEHPSNVIQKGLPSNKLSVVGNASLTWKELLNARTPSGKDTGLVVVTSNPKLISPYLSEGNGSAMLVAMGNGHEFPFFTYTVEGLVPNSTVTMTADVYDLLDINELETALNAMNSNVKTANDYITEIPLPYGSYNVPMSTGKPNYSQGRLMGNIANQFSITAATTTNNGMAPTGTGVATVTPTNGGKQLKISAKADNTGAVSFYLWRNPGGNARPIGLDNITIEGEIMPVIKAGETPCPMNPYTMRLSSTYPAGTTYSWKVAEDGSQTSDMATFSFIPKIAGKYNVTCDVTLPGCMSAKSKTFTFETNKNCCETADGTPLSITTIYKNDFGQFIGSNYVYSDAAGNDYSVPVTESSYCGILQNVIKNQLDNSVIVRYDKDFCSSGDAYVITTEDPYSGSGGDHTGNNNGGMLIMDLKSEGWKNKAIFKKEIEGICKNTNIFFSAAVQAFNDITGKPGNPTSIGTLELVLKSASGSVLASSGEVTLTKPGWFELSSEVMLSKDEPSVTLELISLEDDYSADGRGDFAVDDIKIQVCAPPDVDIKSNLSGEESLNLCSDKEFVLKAVTTTAVKKYYKDINYLFQWTTDDPSVVKQPNWHDLGSPSTDDAYVFKNPVNEEPFLSSVNKPDTRLFFRLVVGDKSILTTDRDWEDMNAQSPCRNVSISNIPIIAGLNCATTCKDIMNTVDNSKKIEYRKSDAKGGSLKSLDKQSGSTFRAALSMSDYSFHIGLVEGATEATVPDMSTAKFGSASTTIPVPTVKDVDSSDDEYLWYYTYLESAEGCLSDTVLVGVVIKGAPSPTPKDAAYCVNSGDVKPMSEYATPASEDPAGELVFYGPDKTTRMHPSDLPDVSMPGGYTYYVSQISSTGGGESTKQPIVIEVYGVNDVDLSETDHKYCKGADATPLENIVSKKPSSDYYIRNSGWEFFEANEPTLNEKTAGAETSMKVNTSTAGVFKYYARLKYEMLGSTEVCYGNHMEYTAEIQSVADPITGTVTYLKAEGKNGFKKPTEQNPDAIIGDASCTDCSIVWFDVNKNEIDESDATPKYDASLIGSVVYTYYVKQINALGCESLFKPVTIIVDATPTSLTNTPAKAVSITPNPASTKVSVIAEEAVEKVEILNMVGEVVKVSNRKDIDTSNLSNGVYFVRTTINDETTVHKLVINK